VQRRRFLGLSAAGVATAATASCVTACGGGTGSGGITLKLVAADYGDSSANSSRKYWDQLAREYEADHRGVTIDVYVYPWTEIDQKVADMVERGQAPDVAQIDAYADYAAEGRLYSADQMLAIPVQANFISSIEQAGEVAKVQYGLPFVTSTRLLFYNKTLFERAGVLAAPKSWDELKQAAIQLKSVGVKMPYGLPLGPEEAQAETLMWMLGGGGGYTDVNGSYTIDAAENVTTFEWLRDELVGPGLTGSKDPGRLNRQAVFDAFTSGDVGMLNGHPTLMAQAEGHGISYATAPLPGITGRSKSTLGVADWMMGFRQRNHRAQVGDFLNYVFAKKHVLDFAEAYDLLPVTTDASQVMRADKHYERLWQFLDQLETAVFYPVAKTSWADVAELLKQKIGTAVVKGGDPATVLGQIQRKAEALEKTSS
jgi:multiple sugar transport system substrate-binding protein